MNTHTASTPLTAVPSPPLAAPSWRDGLPVLSGPRAVLRELRHADAPGLLPLIAAPEVARFISPPPTRVEQLRWFIEWSHRERIAGRYAAFALVPRGSSQAVGLLQVRQLDDAGTAEWGFAMGVASWGSGLFRDAARLMLAFIFEVMHVRRLEARAAVPNARAHAVLRRLGATEEGVLRGALVTATGERFDQVLWAIQADGWRMAPAASFTRVH
jgi:RimJ/RimL family protein N-acetyltransferase